MTLSVAIAEPSAAPAVMTVCSVLRCAAKIKTQIPAIRTGMTKMFCTNHDAVRSYAQQRIVE